MQYLCLIYFDEARLSGMPSDEANQFLKECDACANSLRENGRFVAGAALEGVRSAMSVRIQNGRPTITDGPFAETKEQLGGFCLIDARDLNEALQIAAAMPPARLGCVEIRPLK
jgi:hypothetical protein